MPAIARLCLLILTFMTNMTASAVLAAQPDNASTTERLFVGTSDDPYLLALRATIWGYPLVRAAQLREKATQPDHPFVPRPPALATAPINRLGRARDLAGPETRIGVAPNNDTLYVLAFLDTEAGPFQLDTPDFGRRYYIFQFGEADSSTEHSYGQSSHGGRLPPIFIVGPDYSGPAPKGALMVRSRQRYLMVAGRVLIDGAKELPLVHRLQDRILLRKWLAGNRLVETPATPQRPLAGEVPGTPERLKFLANLGTVLQDWHPTPEDDVLLASFRRIGLTREGFRYDRLSPSDRAAIESGIADGLAAIADKTRNLGAVSRGWSTSYAGSRFGGDYLLRAAVAMDQIYVLDKSEALYPVAHVDGNGAMLDGRNSYTICFRKQDLPPVHAFWSISLYYAKGFFAPNVISRYSIGDRTPGLVYGKDGSLRISIQNADPGPGKQTNWLPAPAEPFMLMMRLYRPKSSAVEARWHPPAIMPTGAGGKQQPSEPCGVP